MDDAADRLYAVDLDAFVAERAALAKELRASGDKAAAAEIAKLRKPSAAAWALNQLARRAPASLGAVLDAAEAIRVATARREGVREAIAAHREALRAALDAAQELRPNGRPPSASVLEKVRAALAAAAMDEALATALRGGRLVDEMDPAAGDATAAPPLVGAGAGRQADAAPPLAEAGAGREADAAPPRGRGKRKRRTRDGAGAPDAGADAGRTAAEREEAERREQEERRAAEERRRAEAERRLAGLRERRDAALAAADAARTAVEASLARLEDAQRALVRAEKEHEAALAAADDAADALARAQRELDRLDA